MNNSVFGKTMKNLRKRVYVKLVNDKVKLSKLIALPSFDAFRIFSEDTGRSKHEENQALS